jgi:cob(I)alamin adenosyltransferase
MKIYTRTGDKGQTGLANGERVFKTHSLINFVGSLDELNAHVGLCISKLKNMTDYSFKEEIKFLEKIQNNLFVIGSITVYAKLDFDVVKEVKHIENQIDKYEETLPKLTNFILPGGHLIASHIHLLRTNTRKIEILSHGLEHEEIRYIATYFNRLSDYFFVLARFINFEFKQEEPIWKVNN